jgi:predicted glycosyltransferase
MVISSRLFLSHVNSEDELVMVVRSHQDLDELLAQAISEALIEMHFLDVERIPFSLKVELGVALGKIEGDMRSPLLKLNAIRNEFAHDSKTKLTEKHVRDFYNVFVFSDPKMHDFVHRPEETDPITLIRDLISILFVRLRSNVEKIRDQKLWNLALDEEARELLGDSAIRYKDHPSRLESHESITKRFERLKKERDKKE